jgi:hypothetical protein
LNESIAEAAEKFDGPEAQIEAIAYAYWSFAFNNKEYYQLMYGLGMPGCETVNQISELKTFTQLVMVPIASFIEKSSNKDTNAFLKLHTFWSMLHGLISINMMSKDSTRDKMNELVLKDLIKGFIYGIKA